MAKKSVLTFQTPKKRAATPLRSTAKKQGSSAGSHDEDELPRSDSPRCAGNEASRGYEKEDPIENKMITAYRKENAMLRNLKKEALLYSQLLGITIKDADSALKFSIERESSTGHKKLSFSIEERDSIYVYSLENVVNCNIPEYFYDIIEFDKKSFPLFFYKAMQSVYESRIND